MICFSNIFFLLIQWKTKYISTTKYSGNNDIYARQTVVNNYSALADSLVFVLVDFHSNVEYLWALLLPLPCAVHKHGAVSLASPTFEITRICYFRFGEFSFYKCFSICGFAHYLVLDTNVVLEHIDMLESEGINNVIILHTGSVVGTRGIYYSKYECR